MKILYHGVDLDGKCSAAILYQKFPDAELIGLDYNSDFDLDTIEENEEIYMVDFTFQPYRRMIDLRKKCNGNLFWIDHHATAVDASESLGFNDIQGIRKIGLAACELVWSYVHGSVTPYPVFLLGKYDIWQHDLDENILPFQCGMNALDNHPSEKIWKNLLNVKDTMKTHMLVQEIIRDGKAILKYTTRQDERICRSMSFELEFENHTCICINRSHVNSKIFDSVFDASKHDIMLTFCRGQSGWKVSMYSSGSVDVGEIAKKHGGGGHKNAAGFFTNDIQGTLGI